MPVRMPKPIGLIYALSLITATFLVFSNLAMAQPDFNKLADSIWLAEGGTRARRPFGIVSVTCHSYDRCRAICLNTISHNYARYQKNHFRNEDFISFLGKRFAPVGALNDPYNLNNNWVKNVRWFYAH